MIIGAAFSPSALNHPHIISVHDVGEAQGIPFFVKDNDKTGIDRVVGIGFYRSHALNPTYI
jgi:hypothetical protein